MSSEGDYEDAFYKYYKSGYDTNFYNPYNISIKDTQERIKTDLKKEINKQLKNDKINVHYLSYSIHNIDSVINDECKMLINNDYTVNQCETRYLHGNLLPG